MIRLWVPGMCAAIVVAANTQTLSVGLTVGAAPTDVLVRDETTSDADTSSLVLGATIRLRTGTGIGFEVGAFRKNMDHRYAFGRRGLAIDSYDVDASAWDVPVLLHYGRSFRAAPFHMEALALRSESWAAV